MRTSLKSNESGMAIITALLVLMLASGLMAGMFAALIADQKSHATDRDQSMAYAAAHAGLEKLTSNLGALFDTDFSPSAGQINVIDNFPPTIPNFQYVSPGGAAGSGYQISFPADPGPGPNTGNPLASVGTITTGNWDGLQGLITPYTITVTAKSSTGNSEVRLRRELQTVAVPVFQFGIFGQTDLGFHAGPNFNFGGRVHTNGSLYLAQGDGNQLTLSDKVTAFTQVVRDKIINGAQIATTNHEGTVRVRDSGSTYRNLLHTETSGTIATPCVGTATINSNCWTGWKHLSEVTYATNIRTQATGAKLLNLPLAQQGAAPIDLVRRPVVLSNEDAANPVVYAQRYYAQASLRILLSDRAADITGLPMVSAGAPVELTRAALLAAGWVEGAGRVVGTSPGENNGEPGVMTRVSALDAGTGTLTLQTSTNGGAAWGVPTAAQLQWLKWQQINVNTGGAGTNVTCTGMNVAQLTGCGAHIAFANNTFVDITSAAPEPGPGGLWNDVAQINGAVAANAATIPIKNFTIAGKFVATRVFFVGEDPVTCTGFTATTLTGCTWSATATLSANPNEPIYQGATTPHDTPYLHGFIKIERQGPVNVWTDVTMEILNLGFNAPNQEGGLCADPTSTAVIRLQRLRDSGAAACTHANSIDWHDYWPNTIFDAREGNTRTLAATAGMNVGGIFSYVALDVNNYRRWVTGAIGASGNQSLNNNGFIVYFSDRRGNHDPAAAIANAETAEFGFDDSLNPLNAVWAKDNTLNAGEDVNQDGTRQFYGETPWPGDAGAPNYLAAGAVAPFNGNNPASSPWATIPLDRSGRGRLARPVLFRRALKIINGGMVGAVNNVPAAGFTVASENPVYVQGNFNALSTDTAAEPNVATSIVADAITLLSNSWTDALSFRRPNDQANRPATLDTGYRFAMITGKALPFGYPGWGVTEWGSDGGVHNFMRMLENWGGRSLGYRGSMVSLWFSRQAIGPYRADANVYSPPTRGYNFDVDFLTPALLPPGTPAFRDINTLKFRQILRPNQ